jgi:tetratricopeptide (TPR) repeat protein
MKIHLNSYVLLFISILGLFRYELKSQETACPIRSEVGNQLICLPELSGLTECYSKIKDHADNFMIDANQILAFYLNDSTYQQADIIDELIFDDYIVVYTDKNLINRNINDQYIRYLDTVISTSYKRISDENWSRIKSELETKNSLNIDQPVLIEHYYITDNIPAMITITRVSGEKDNIVYVASTVIASVNGKLIVFAYYLFYEGESSIQRVKSMTDYFTRILIELNPQSTPKTDSHEKLKGAIELFNEAYNSSQKGNYQEAIKLYTAAINAFPSDQIKRKSEAFYNRGLNKRFLNDFTGAVQDYSEAIKLQPEHYQAYNNRGFVYQKLGKYVNAKEDFDYIITSSDSPLTLKATAYGNRGVLKFKINQDGCSDLQKAVDLGNQGFLVTLEKICK